MLSKEDEGTHKSKRKHGLLRNKHTGVACAQGFCREITRNEFGTLNQ